jgi:hypothetical protein
MMERVYRPYWEWEEIEHNMWGCVDDRKKHLKNAIEFTGDHKRYGRFMMRVIIEWPVSCENALTDDSINKKAWVGHAATALALGCPEDITREAWSNLTDEQQLLANNQARKAIQTWEHNYLKDSELCESVGGPLLL